MPYKDPDQRSKYWREYKARKGDAIRAHQNARNAAMTAEERRARNCEAHKRNAEKRCSYARQYCKANAEERKAKRQAWAKTEIGRIAVCHYSHVRRARLRGVVCTATRKDVREFISAATICHYCRKAFGPKLGKTLDHVTPIKLGGPHSVENFAAACLSCNSQKQGQHPIVFAQKRLGLLMPV